MSLSRGKWLKTQQGLVPFTNEEYSTYSNLSRVLDRKDSDNLFWHLVQRCEVKEEEIHSLLHVVKSSSIDNEGGEAVALDAQQQREKLTFSKALVFLKGIAHLQRLSTLRPNDEVRIDQIFFIALHDAGTDGTKSLAEFNLKRLVSPNSMLLRDSFDTYVSGYELSTPIGSYESVHVRFRITTTTTPSGKLELLSEHSRSPYKTEVTRRFKDFEFLVRMLRESAPGCVVPPLPSKGFVFNSISESVALQRGRELTYFLSKLAEHPVLRHSIALKAFLECSIEGFKAFREILIPKPLVAATSDMLSIAGTAAESGMKIVSKQLGSLFDFVGQKVLEAAGKEPPPPSPEQQEQAEAAASASSSSAATEDLTLFPRVSATFSSASQQLSAADREPLLRLVKQLNDVSTSADACNNLLDCDARLANSVALLGSSLVGLSGTATEPALDVQLGISGDHLERIGTAHTSALDIQRQICATPYSFLGRYSDSVQVATETYASTKVTKDSLSRAALEQRDALRRAKDRFLPESVQLDRAQGESAAADKRAVQASEAETQALAWLCNDKAEVDDYLHRNLRGIVGSFLEARSEVCREQAELWEKLRDALLEAHFSPDDLHAANDAAPSSSSSSSAPSSSSASSSSSSSSASGARDEDLERAIAASLASSSSSSSSLPSAAPSPAPVSPATPNLPAEQEQEDGELNTIAFNEENPLG